MAKKKSKPEDTTPAPASNPAKQSTLVWTLVSVAVATLGAAVARKLVNSLWRTATGKKPPANPSNPEVDVREAVLWAIFSGTVVTLVKILLTRRAANYYVKSTGQLPPGLAKKS